MEFNLSEQQRNELLSLIDRLFKDDLKYLSSKMTKREGYAEYLDWAELEPSEYLYLSFISAAAEQARKALTTKTYKELEQVLWLHD